MDAQTFIANFGHFANSPDGMKRLREMILHFAVSGRLLPDSPSNSRAEDDITEAQALKAAYRKKLKLRDMDSDEPITESEQYFPIPSHWQWSRLGNVASYVQRGKGPKYDDKGQTVVVSQKCVQWSGFNLAVARTISDESTADYGDERFLVKGDLLWNSTGTGTAGRIGEFPGSKKRVVTDSHVTVIRLTNFIPAYLRSYLASPVIQQRMEPGVENTLVTGTTNQVELPTSKVAALPIPCPPVEEQKRIVAKVDELMALCDRLETQQQERQKLFPLLSQASHERFTRAANPANLNCLFDTIGDISPNDLRKTILNLAFVGKLIPQSNSDESASELLKKARAEKAKLIAEGSVKREPWAAGLHAASELYALPSGWTWTHISDVVEKVTVGFVGSMKNHYRPKGVPFLRSQNVRVNRYDPNGLVFISEEFHRTILKSSLKPGDLVVTRSGNVGVTCVIPESLEESNCSDLVIIKRPIAILPKFLCYYINSVASGQIESKTVGVALTHFNTKSVAQLTVALPPLNEQHRIVAKVDQLMALIDTLEKQQQAREHLAETFAQAVVASLTGTQIAERKEKMKAPKTELISNLALGTKPKAKNAAPLAALLLKAKGELSAKSLWQQSGLTIDAFYQQLKTELAHGWIAPPQEAGMKIVEKSNKQVIESEPDTGSSQGFFERGEEYESRIAREANEAIIKKITGSAPNQGFFESSEEYESRIAREAKEAIIENVTGSAPKQGLFESDEEFKARMIKEAKKIKP